jgi:hypothetical protein
LAGEFFQCPRDRVGWLRIDKHAARGGVGLPLAERAAAADDNGLDRFGLIQVGRGGAGGMGKREQDAAEESDRAHQALP